MILTVPSNPDGSVIDDFHKQQPEREGWVQLFKFNLVVLGYNQHMESFRVLQKRHSCINLIIFENLASLTTLFYTTHCK